MKSVPKLIRRFLAILMLSIILLFFLNIVVLITLNLQQTPGASPWTTAVETGASLDREMIANFPSLLPELAFTTYIRKNIDVKKAPIALLPLCQYAPKCTASADYAALCDEMLDRMGG